MMRLTSFSTKERLWWRLLWPTEKLKSMNSRLWPPKCEATKPKAELRPEALLKSSSPVCAACMTRLGYNGNACRCGGAIGCAAGMAA